jgi:general secretion pathway protein D
MNTTRTLPGLALLYCLLGLPLVGQAQTEASLNLKDADIRTLVDTVSRVTGRNFVVDPRVKANVTVITSRPMEKEELYQVFLSILEVHGYAAVPVGEIIKIVPDANARQGPVPTVGDANPGSGDELVTRVLQIRHVPAAQLVPILRPLVPQQGHLAAYPATNVLVVSDRAANIDRLAAIVNRIDRSESEEIEVITLRHASASEIVRIINSLSQADPQGQGSPGKPMLAADDRTNSILLSGDRPARLRVRGLIAHLDTPLEAYGGTQVIFLKHAKADEMVTVLQGTAKFQQQQGQQARPPGTGQDIDIQADKTNNALIVTAPADMQRNIASVVRQLDIPRAQVLVEAVIAEVSTDLSRDLGVAWAVDGTQSDQQGPVAVSNVGGIAETVLNVATGNAAPPVGLLFGAGDLREGRTNWAVVLRALAGDAATNILSTPTLVTTDNEEAEIVVGQNVPFITGSYTTTGDTGSINNPFQTIQRQDVGLSLRVTPQVNEGNKIKLAIEQEVSSIASSAASAADLITNKRLLRTAVTVEDGQILVLGGLIEDSFRDRQEKVPLLGDIPLLGRLFRYDTTQKVKQNLMVFIHPAIIKDSIQAGEYTNRKYDYLRARQLEAGIGQRGLIHDSKAMFPDLEELVTQLPPAEVLTPRGTGLNDLVTPLRTGP